MSLHLILYIVAAVCFAIGAFGEITSRVNLVAAGLLAWVLTLIV